MMWWGSWGWGSWLAMTVLMVAFWAVLIWAAVTIAGRPGAPSDGESVLAERFARGDIDDEEYRRRRRLLRSHD